MGRIYRIEKDADEKKLIERVNDLGARGWRAVAMSTSKDPALPALIWILLESERESS